MSAASLHFACIRVVAVCPKNLAANPSGEVIFGATMTCSSAGGTPDPKYQWLDSDGTVLSSTDTVTVPGTSGQTFNYTCVATSTYDGRVCTAMQAFPGTTVSGLLNVFSERDTYVHVRYMLSAVRLSSDCRLSVCRL